MLIVGQVLAFNKTGRVLYETGVEIYRKGHVPCVNKAHVLVVKMFC